MDCPQVLLGCVKVVSTGAAVVFIDSAGRRTFFLAGLTLMAVAASLLVAATAALGHSSNCDGGDGGSTGEGGGGSGGKGARGGLQVLVVVGCLLYTVAYQLSFGPGVFILGAEMFPPAIRGRLLGLQTLWGSACLAFTSEVFPALVEGWSLAAAFSVHLAFVAAAGVFVATCVVETRGRSPEATRRALEALLFAPPQKAPHAAAAAAASEASSDSRSALAAAPATSAGIWRRRLAQVASRLCCPSPPDDDGGSANDPEDDQGSSGGRGEGGSSGHGGRGSGRRSQGFEMVARDASFSAELV
jgi:hypothetical protein